MDGAELEGQGAGGRLGLFDCLKSLDDFVAARPAREPVLAGLVAFLDFGERERAEVRAGVHELWSLIPPIDQEAIEGADLSPAGLKALANALALLGQQRLFRANEGVEEPEREEDLKEIERMARFTLEALAASGHQSRKGGIGRLDRLKMELQARRLELAQARRDDEQASGAVVRSDGLISARRSDKAGSLLDALLRSRPGAELPTESSEPEELEAWHTNPEVPAPRGLYSYISALGRAEDGVPQQESFYTGLIDLCDLGEPELEAFRDGRSALAALTPPIQPASLANSGLSDEAFGALLAPLALSVQHNLAYFEAEQPAGVPIPLRQLGEFVQIVRLVVEGAPGELGGPLSQLIELLEARGVDLGGAERKVAAVREGKARRDEAEQKARLKREGKAARKAARAKRPPGKRMDPEKARMLRLAVGLTLVIALGIGTFLSWRPPASAVRVSEFPEVPAVGIVQRTHSFTLRVHPSWLDSPRDSREKRMLELWDRMQAERGADLEWIEVRTTANEALAKVSYNGVTWAK